MRAHGSDIVNDQPASVRTGQSWEVAREADA
jgi:hypothetical protein